MIGDNHASIFRGKMMGYYPVPTCTTPHLLDNDDSCSSGAERAKKK